MKKLSIGILFLIMIGKPLIAEAIGPSVFADLLVFHASQETSSTFASTLSGSGRTLDFEATNVNFGWKSGFRGGLQYELEPDCWNTKLYWTYVPSKASKGFAIADQIVVPEFFSGFLSGNFFFGANIHWRLIMNMVDVELGRKLKINDALSIRPSIGIKGGTIRQTINCHWNAGIYTAAEAVKHNFSGLGPSFGIESKWNIYNTVCNTFGLFGDFSTAFLWGNWKVNDTYSRPAALLGLVTPTTITTSMNNSKLGTLMSKYRMGLEWIYEGSFRLSFQLGYEMQFWANQLRIPTFQQLPVHGGLTLQGGTCQILIDF